MTNIRGNKKQLSPGQREELLRALQARFEKNITVIKVSNGLQYKPSSKPMPGNCGHSMKWKEPAANPTLLITIKRQANTFFMIAQRRAPRAAEVFAMTVTRCSQGKSTNR